MLKASLALALLLAGTAHAQPLKIPSEPIAAVEGEWFAEDADLAVEIHNGVVTAKSVKTKGPYITAGGVSDGVVIARWTGFNGEAKGNSFSGDCWTTGGEGWRLYKCAQAGNIAVNTNGRTWFYRLRPEPELATQGRFRTLHVAVQEVVARPRRAAGRMFVIRACAPWPSGPRRPRMIASPRSSTQLASAA